MKTVTLKKSELAKQKGLGNDYDTIAKSYGIKAAEVKSAMMFFGLSKAKPKAKKEGEYEIVLVDDVTVNNTPVESPAEMSL